MHGWIIILLISLVSMFSGMAIAEYSWLILSKMEDIKFVKKNAFVCMTNTVVGLIDACLNIVIYWIYGLSIESTIYMLAVIFLTAVSIIDWNSYEIPIQFNYVLLFLGIIRTLFDIGHWYIYIIGMFTVSGIFFLLALATKGRGMGGGDIKLMFTCGLILGWQKILLVMIMGSLLGAVIHSVIMRVSKKEHMLAFGPYLATAVYITICCGQPVIDWYLGQFKQY